VLLPVHGVTEGNRANNAAEMIRSQPATWLRRIGFTLAGIALLWTAAWFALAGLIESRIAQTPSPLLEACKDRDLRGFPSAFTLHCTTFNDGKRLATKEANVSLPIFDLGRGGGGGTSPPPPPPPRSTPQAPTPRR
jgi:hypothetical protein